MLRHIRLVTARLRHTWANRVAPSCTELLRNQSVVIHGWDVPLPVCVLTGTAPGVCRQLPQMGSHWHRRQLADSICSGTEHRVQAYCRRVRSWIPLGHQVRPPSLPTVKYWINQLHLQHQGQREAENSGTEKGFTGVNPWCETAMSADSTSAAQKEFQWGTCPRAAMKLNEEDLRP